MSFIPSDKQVVEHWGWIPPDKWTNADDVNCTNNQFVKKDKSFCLATIKRGKHHGITTAESDYYYLVLGGSGKVQVLDGSNPIAIKAGDSFCIEAGTEYDYWADDEGDLKFVLFMSKVWEEE